MTSDHDARIIALANGEAVGEACYCVALLVNSLRPSPLCSGCRGTGRIRTEPETKAEWAVAKLRATYAEKCEAWDMFHGERRAIARTLDGERAAHTETQRECEEQARLNGMGAEREARLIAAHEETKRQLAALQAKLDPKAQWCTGEWPCEASLVANEFREDNEKLEEQLVWVRERVHDELCVRSTGKHHPLCEEVRRG